MLPYEFCEIFKSSYFIEHVPATVSVFFHIRNQYIKNLNRSCRANKKYISWIMDILETATFVQRPLIFLTWKTNASFIKNRRTLYFFQAEHDDIIKKLPLNRNSWLFCFKDRNQFSMKFYVIARARKK